MIKLTSRPVTNLVFLCVNVFTATTGLSLVIGGSTLMGLLLLVVGVSLGILYWTVITNYIKELEVLSSPE